MSQRAPLFLRARRGILEGLGPPLLVQVQRVHLVLAIEPGHELVCAREFQDLDLADDQRVVAGVRRERLARERRQEGERGARTQV
jgi:hypothetical protein